MGSQEILADVSPENYFYVCNGTVLKNIPDLHLLLKNIDSGVFNYHVNEGKNDFLNWVRDVIKDEVLTRNFGKCKTKDETLACVKRRISTLNRKKSNGSKKIITLEGKKPFKPVYANEKEKKNIMSIIAKLKNNI